MKTSSEVNEDIVNKRNEFILKMEKYVDAGYALSATWQELRDDPEFLDILNTINWPFTWSFDEYVAEMHHHWDTIKVKLQ